MHWYSYIPVYGTFFALDFALNTISRCAFGIDTLASKEQHQELLKYGQSLVNSLKMKGWLATAMMQLMQLFPYLETKIGFWPPEFDKFWTLTKTIMNHR